MSEKEKSILIVEDDPVNALIFEKFLSKAGFITETVHSGEQAASLVSKKLIFDLLLLDINLGASNYDGVDVMHEYEKFHPGAATKYLAVTAYASTEDRDSFLAEGFDEYLTKPIKRELLLSTIADLLPA